MTLDEHAELEILRALVFTNGKEIIRLRLENRMCRDLADMLRDKLAAQETLVDCLLDERLDRLAEQSDELAPVSAPTPASWLDNAIGRGNAKWN